MFYVSRLINDVDLSAEFWKALRKGGKRSQHGFSRLGLDVSPLAKAASASVEKSCVRFQMSMGRRGMANGMGFGRVAGMLRRFRGRRYL